MVPSGYNPDDAGVRRTGPGVLRGTGAGHEDPTTGRLHPVWPVWPLAVVVTLGLVAGATPAKAQTPDGLAAPRPVDEPAWMSAWSPLRPLGQLVLNRPVSNPILPSVLLDPPPRVGAFWNAGNPGAIAHEIESSYLRAGSGYEEASGEQRRPLDPATGIHRRVEGRAWGPMGESGAGTGHVTLLRSRFAEGANATVPVPYATSPLVLGDSLGHTLGATTARVEGAGGWALGEVAFGLAMGFEAEEARTVASSAPRSVRTSTPGLSMGLTWRPAEGVPRLGAYTRWRRSVRAVQVIARTAPDRVYEFVGFDEPLRAAGGGFFSRRLESGARAVGASLSGHDFGLRWVVWGQTETLTDERFEDLTREPVVETWEADSGSGGLGLEGTLGERLRASLVGRYTTVSGDLFRPRFDDPTYAAEMNRWRWTGDLRLVGDGEWRGGLRVHLVRDARTREDRVARVSSRFTAWEYGAGLTVGRELTSGLRLSLGGGLTRYVPTAIQVPNPAAMEELYRLWIAPELAVYATEATVRSGMATLSVDVSPGTALWLRAAAADLSPGEAGQIGTSEGDRGSFRVELGVRTGRR